MRSGGSRAGVDDASPMDWMGGNTGAEAMAGESSSPVAVPSPGRRGGRGGRYAGGLDGRQRGRGGDGGGTLVAARSAVAGKTGGGQRRGRAGDGKDGVASGRVALGAGPSARDAK